MSEKLKIVLEVDGHKSVLTLPDDLMLHEATINKEVAEQPGWYAHFAYIATRLALKRDGVAQALRDTSAAVELRVRQTAAAVPGEKTTEAKIAAKVQLDPEVLKAREALSVAERQSAEAALVKEAFYQRLQAMIALSANIRNERSQQSST